MNKNTVEDKDTILNLIYNKMKDLGVWFVTESDRVFGNKICYKLNEYGKLDDDKQINNIIKNIHNFIGDGASNIDEAVLCWIQQAMYTDNSINYTDGLHMNFKDEPIVDGLQASVVDLNKKAGPGKATAVCICNDKEIKTEGLTYDKGDAGVPQDLVDNKEKNKNCVYTCMDCGEDFESYQITETDFEGNPICPYCGCGDVLCNDILDESKKQEDFADKNETYIVIETGLSDKATEEILDSVIGQLSDGIWENNSAMNRYWSNMDVERENGQLVVKCKTGYGSGFYGKTNNQIREWLANKVKQIVKEEELKWDRNNTEISWYLDRHNGTNVTVQDAYRVYDKLKGRIDRIQPKTESSKYDKYKVIVKDKSGKTREDIIDVPSNWDDVETYILDMYSNEPEINKEDLVYHIINKAQESVKQDLIDANVEDLTTEGGEDWIAFYLGDKELASYTLNGTFDGELPVTREELANEYNVSIEDIKVKAITKPLQERRIMNHNKQKVKESETELVDKQMVDKYWQITKKMNEIDRQHRLSAGTQSPLYDEMMDNSELSDEDLKRIYGLTKEEIHILKVVTNDMQDQSESLQESGKIQTRIVQSQKLTESERYEVWQKYYEDGEISLPEYVQSFDTYKEAQRFAEGLNEDPNCEAWVKEPEELTESITKYNLLTIDKEGNEVLLSNTSYNKACNWLSNELKKNNSEIVGTKTLDTDKIIIKTNSGINYVYSEKEGSLKKLSESVIPNSTNSVCPKCGSNNFLEIDDEEDEDGTQHFHTTCQDCGYTEKDEITITESDNRVELANLAKEVFDWYDNEMGTHFDEIKGNEEEVYKDILASLEDKDQTTLDKFISDMQDDASMIEVVSQLKSIREDNKLIESNEEEVNDTDIQADIDDRKTPEYELNKKTQDIYNKLTNRGLRVEITTDNGENEVAVIVNDENGRVIIPVRDETTQYVAVTRGSISLNNDSLRLLNQIKDIIEEEL